MQTPHNFAQVRNRLLIIGVIVCAGGVIFETLATNLLSLLFSLQGGAGGGVGLWLTGFIVSVVRFGLAPLGASLVRSASQHTSFETRSRTFSTTMARTGRRQRIRSQYPNPRTPTQIQRRYPPGMGNLRTGYLARDERRERRRRIQRKLSYVGLGVLAAATIFVVTIALRH